MHKIFLIFWIFFWSNALYAEDLLKSPPPNNHPDNKEVFNFVYENDIFNKRDDGYTNGVRLAWSSYEKPVNKWVDVVAAKLIPKSVKAKKRSSIAIGQSMFTPKNLMTPNLIPDDRPYAGWLYGSYGVIYDTDKTLDTLMVTVGVVGPLSGAEETQKIVHHNMVGSPNPQGWDHQLRNEPGLILTYEKKWRNILEFSDHNFAHRFGFDITPQYGIDLGNVSTAASIGSTIRIGYDLPVDYGPPRVRPSLPGSDFFVPTKKWAGYLFAGIQGHAVGRNIFLDGNTFVQSHHVHKRTFIGDLQLGLAITRKNWRFTYTQVHMTKEFYGQEKAQKYGTLSVSYRF